MKEQGVFGDRIIIPTENTFKRRLLKDFSLEEIRQIRTKYLFLPEEFLTEQTDGVQKKKIQKTKNIEFMNCKNLLQASELFLKSDNYYSITDAGQKNIQSVLNKHLLPFFKDIDLKLNRISISKILGIDGVQKYRTKYQIREIFIPLSLRKILKTLTSKDFEKFNENTFFCTTFYYLACIFRTTFCNMSCILRTTFLIFKRNCFNSHQNFNCFYYSNNQSIALICLIPS